MLAQGRDGLGDVAYERHQPEQTLLYQLVEAHYPALVDQLAQHDKSLPDHVNREFEACLKCGRLEHGFLRVRCDKCRFERPVDAFLAGNLRWNEIPDVCVGVLAMHDGATPHTVDDVIEAGWRIRLSR